MDIIKTNLPALDNEQLRKLNTKKVINAIDNIGSAAKVWKWKSLLEISIFLAFLFLFLGSIVGFTGIGYGSAKDYIYNCSSNGLANLTFRMIEKADSFKKTFPNSTCYYSK